MLSGKPVSDRKRVEFVCPIKIEHNKSDYIRCKVKNCKDCLDLSVVKAAGGDFCFVISVGLTMLKDFCVVIGLGNS